VSIEDRLRHAITARTSAVEPSADGLDRIHDKLNAPGGDMDLTHTNRWYLVAAVAALVLAVAGGTLALVGGDGDDGGTTTADQPGAETTTTEPTTTTTDATTDTTATTPTTSGPAVGPEAPGGSGGLDAQEEGTVVWPRPSSDVRFDDPSAAANSWARFYAGFTDPQIGEYRAGDNRSGEVPIFPLAGNRGEETTVAVRRMSDGHWYVVASNTQDITPSEPAFDDRLTCPQLFQGTALAFEGTVQVRIDAYRPDGRRVTVAEGFVTGSGSPPAGPYESSLPCEVPGTDVEPYGIVRLTTTDEGETASSLVAVTYPIRLR
jgi:hypothetical protein